MTDPGALADEGLAISGYRADDGAWADYLDDQWVAVGAHHTAAPPPPWFRNPRLLLGLIGLAAAALVVASVLLITGRQSGEIPTSPQLSSRTTPAVADERSGPRPSSEPPRATETSSSPSPSASGSESPSSEAVETAESLAPALSTGPAPPPPATDGTRTQVGPNLNVTRTPMSFSPGKH